MALEARSKREAHISEGFLSLGGLDYGVFVVAEGVAVDAAGG